MDMDNNWLASLADEHLQRINDILHILTVEIQLQRNLGADDELVLPRIKFERIGVTLPDIENYFELIHRHREIGIQVINKELEQIAARYELPVLASVPSDKYFSDLIQSNIMFRLTDESVMDKMGALGLDVNKCMSDKSAIPITFNKSTSAIQIGNLSIPIRNNTNHYWLCLILFRDEKSRSKIWSWDEVLEAWGDKYPESAKDWRKVYSAARAINEKVSIATGQGKELINTSTKTVSFNKSFSLNN